MSIKSLCESKGFSYEVVARNIGVDPMLIDRIDDGIQPIGIVTARKIAGYIGSDVPSVLAEAPFWTDSTSQASEQPVVLPSLQNPLTPVKYAEQTPLAFDAVPAPKPPPTALIIARNTSAGDTEIFRMDRDTGARTASVTIHSVMNHRGFAFANDFVWAVEQTAKKPRAYYPYPSPIVPGVVGGAGVNPTSIEAVSASRNVFIVDEAGRLSRLDQTTGMFPVFVQVPGYYPKAACEAGENLVSIWPDNPGNTVAQVILHDMDLNVIAANEFAIPVARDVGYGAGSYWVVGGTAINAGVWRVSADMNSVVKVISFPDVEEPNGVLFFDGKLYVCDLTATDHVLKQFDTTSFSLLESRTYTGRNPFSRPKADPPYVWVSDPNTPINAPMRKFSPPGLVEVLTVPLYQTHPITTSGATAFAVIPFGAVGPSPI